MADIFLSYSSKNRSSVKPLVDIFRNSHHWSVFWDQEIAVREKYFERLQTELQSARAVVVIWTESALHSRWVMEEADYAANRGLLYPVKFESIEPPLGFRTIHTIDLINWKGDTEHSGITHLVGALRNALGVRRATKSLPIPEPHRPLTDDHVALIHTSWRDKSKDTDFNTPMYQIRVGLFGSPVALERVESVRYLLDPSYPKAVYDITEASDYFQLKELANGYSVVRAEVKVKGQPELIRISRFINLTETGPRLDEIARFDPDY